MYKINASPLAVYMLGVKTKYVSCAHIQFNRKNFGRCFSYIYAYTPRLLYYTFAYMGNLPL